MKDAVSGTCAPPASAQRAPQAPARYLIWHASTLLPRKPWQTFPSGQSDDVSQRAMHVRSSDSPLTFTGPQIVPSSHSSVDASVSHGSPAAAPPPQPETKTQTIAKYRILFILN